MSREEYLCSGLISMIFLTEPVGLAPKILTEPDGKTVSPVNTVFPNFQMISAYIRKNSF